MNRLLKKRMVIIPITLVFLIIILYVSYAYYNAEVSGNESVSTVAVNGGFINIDYVNNSGTITAANIIPGWKTTKSFTISSSTNFADSSLLNNTWYDVLLVVEQNDFLTVSLEYMLTISEEDENKEGIYKNSEYYQIPTGTNLDGIVLGSGYLPNVGITHTYNLTLRYIDSDDIDQTTDMYAKFYARVNVRGSDLTTITFDLDGGTLSNFTINEESKSRIAKNTSVYIPVPVKGQYAFVGWEILEGNVNVNSNIITTNQSDIELKALWTSTRPYEFDYTGGEQQFIAQYPGYYKVEIWGAQGGSYGTRGGYGGYSYGQIYIERKDLLFLNVGGTTTTSTGGYNGGGNSGTKYNARGGGGATHISTTTGVIANLEDFKNTILIVAGGGGGSDYYDSVGSNGGEGGGIVGNSGSYYRYSSSALSYTVCKGGTQIAGGAGGIGKYTGDSGTFGLGGDSGGDIGGGGGGGIYGGGGGSYNTSIVGSGAGGSGYIGNSLLFNKYMYCYNCATSDEESTKTFTTTCAEETPTENCAKKGNGYARITYLHN